MLNEENTVIKLRYCIVKGVVGYLMHISADKRLLKKDRRITQIVFFAIMTAFFVVGSTQFPEHIVKLISLILAGVCLVLCGVFALIFVKGKKNYLFAEDQIIDAEISESAIKASVNGRERNIQLNGETHFTQNSEYYIFNDEYGGFFIPFDSLEPNEKYLAALWFSKGAIYDQPRLRGKERAPKLKF